jgi:hypothetical protein
MKKIIVFSVLALGAIFVIGAIIAHITHVMDAVSCGSFILTGLTFILGALFFRFRTSPAMERLRRIQASRID